MLRYNMLKKHLCNMDKLNLSLAIKEIVEAILNINPTDKDGELHLQIKSSKKNVSSRSEAEWFYIKVSTSAKVRKETFSGFHHDSWLYEVLRSMHIVEDDSHLCLQCPQQDDYVQYNLVLNGQTLEVQHETTKTKQHDLSVLYLRLHQQFMHVLDQSKLIHDYLLLLKVFRPQWNITFNIKLGDVKSRDRFRVDDWMIVGDGLPPIVTDPEFYLSKSDIIPVGHCAATSTTCQLHTDTMDELQLTIAGCVIPVGRKQTKYCSFTMNVYGKHFTPMEIQGNRMTGLLEKVNWSHLGFKLSPTAQNQDNKLLHFPCQGRVFLEPDKISSVDPCVIVASLVLHPGSLSSTFTQGIDLVTILSQNEQTCVQCIESFVKKALEPLQEKVKVRGITHKSILSVCKAVTDIVTLSSNEDFRNNMLSCMQVNDKVDLGKGIENKLMSISKSRHRSVWTGWENTDTDLDLHEEPISVNNRLCQEYKKHSLKLTQQNTQEISSIQNTLIDRSEAIGDIDQANVHTTVGERPAISVPISPFQKLVDSDTESDAGNTEQRLSCVENDDTSKIAENDRTPEIVNLTEKMHEVSPFRELADAEFVDPIVQHSLSEDPHQFNFVTAKGDCCDAAARAVNKKALCAYELHQSGNVTVNVTEKGNCSNASTTDKHNKVLSAYEFHEIQRHIEPSCTHPLAGVFNTGKDNVTEDFDSLQNEIVSDFVQISEKECSIRPNSNMSSKLAEMSDFELMKHEDFPATLQVVSDFIDKTATSILGKHQDISSVERQIIEKSSVNTIGKDNKITLDQIPPHYLQEDPDSDEWFDDVLMDVEHWLN